jgi:DNA ligase 1
MKEFAELFLKLDQTNKTNEKIQALVDFFKVAEDEDKLWTIALLSHRRPRRVINTTLLRIWAAEVANLPLWLFEEAWHITGDLAETIALVLPQSSKSSVNQSLSQWITSMIRRQDDTDKEKKEFVLNAWSTMDYAERFVFNKLITGGFRMGVSQKLMTRALSISTGIIEEKLAHRLMGSWTPDQTTYEKLVLYGNEDEDLSKPYPFYLAYALENRPEDLGNIGEWQAEWKWDGIRAQLICRGGQIYIWSRGEELITYQYPELIVLSGLLPEGTVLDGELVVYKNGAIQSFNELQSRIGRKKVSAKLLQTSPVCLLAYDLLEWNGQDIRYQPLVNRRELLERVVYSIETLEVLKIPENILVQDWASLAETRLQSRSFQAEGLILKRKNAPYLSGRKRGDWWKWKIDPLTIDAVMIYAQRGHGRRANLYTDYTFAVWYEGELVPFTKAYSGLTDAEFREVTSFVRKNTLESYGPVRAVKPELVMEIGFEGLWESPRHKSGVALRFPRILRWRKDKSAKDANTLSDLKLLL